MVTKEKEIKMLEDLMKADGYFAEYFKKDLDQMVENIKNDFPIELGTQFLMDADNQREINAKLKESYKAEIKAINEDHEAEIRELLVTMLKDAEERDYDNIEAVAVRKLGRNEVIKLKREQGIELSENDIDYMISKLV